MLYPSLLAAEPEIKSLSPLAVIPGTKTVLNFSGSGLGHASNLWTSFNGTARRIANTNSEVASFSIECPADESGIHAAQLIGPGGASNFQLLMIDELKGEHHLDQHRSLDSRLKISPPAAVDCRLKPGKIDYYEFSARDDELFSIEVIAHRVGSQMDPVVRVLDSAGRELAFCDDEDGVWKDARFQFRAPAAGVYTIAVHDVGYGGGRSYFYRLRITHDPLIWFTFPLLDTAEAMPVERVGIGTRPRSAGSPANPSSAQSVNSLPLLIEREPNDARASVAAVTAPAIVNGKIGTSRDLDLYAFVVSQDQKLVFQSQTRSLGSPCDLALRIKDASGSVLAQSDLSLPGDAALTNAFAEPGIYTLEVSELSGGAISNLPYRIRIQQFVPGFAASSEKNLLNLQIGESTKAKISVARFDYEGPIEFDLEPPVAGLTIEGKIEEKKNETELIFKAAAEAEPGTFQHARLRARSTNGFSMVVSTRPALKESFPLLLHPPPWLDTLLTVVLTPK